MPGKIYLRIAVLLCALAAANAQYGPTRLAGPINSTQTYFSVVSNVQIDAPAIFWIGNECVYCASVTNNDFSNCTRGYNGTAQTQHSGTIYIYGSPNEPGGPLVLRSDGGGALASLVLGPYTLASGAKHLPNAASGNAGWITIVTDSQDCQNSTPGQVQLCRSNGNVWSALGGSSSLGFVPKGTYTGGTSYSKGDLVGYGTPSVAYVALQDCAACAHLPTEAAYWATPGPTGPNGADGAAGSTGPAGPVCGTPGQYIKNSGGVCAGVTSNAANGPMVLDANGNAPMGARILTGTGDTLPDQTTPANPSAGTTKTYSKGGKLCSLSPAGVENCTGTSGGGSYAGCTADGSNGIACTGKLAADHFTGTGAVSRSWLKKGTAPTDTVDPDGATADGVTYLDTADSHMKLRLSGGTVIDLTPVGGGDASTNTSTSVDGEMALFSGSGGKTIKRATGTGYVKVTAGVMGTPAAIPVADLPGDYICDDTGTANALACTISGLSSYTRGEAYYIYALHANTTAATVNFGGGVVAIKKVVGGVATDLTANDIRDPSGAVRQLVGMRYDGTNMQAFTVLGNTATVAASQLTRTCEIHIWGDGTSGVLQDTNDEPASCMNKTGATLTITSVECRADAGSPTVMLATTGGPNLLTGNLTAGTASFAAGTLSGTPTQAANATLDINIVSAGGTAKSLICVVGRTL